MPSISVSSPPRSQRYSRPTQQKILTNMLLPTPVVNLQSYPENVFRFLLTLGLWFVRKRRKAMGAPRGEFVAWNVVLVFTLLVNVYLLILPWVPPEGGIYAGDVSFFYATYCIVGLALYVLSLSRGPFAKAVLGIALNPLFQLGRLGHRIRLRYRPVAQMGRVHHPTTLGATSRRSPSKPARQDS